MKTIILGLALLLSINAHAHHLQAMGWCVNGKAVFQTVLFNNSLNVEVQYRTSSSNPWILATTFNTSVSGSTTKTFGVPQPNQNQTVQVRFRYKSFSSVNWNSWSSPQSSITTLSVICSALPISYINLTAKWIDKSTVQLNIKVGEVTGNNLIKVQIKGGSGLVYEPVFVEVNESEGSDKTYILILTYHNKWILSQKIIE